MVPSAWRLYVERWTAGTTGRSKLIARMRRPAQAALTPRELDVLNAVADGLTNAEIGSRLVIAEATVKTCLLRLFAKLEVNDRTHARGEGHGARTAPSSVGGPALRSGT
ncbi:response regulator transcription factor [Nonomuraea fuscirosea]|uniref:response regulator transcription factor n=1 Tax=Nonomuraea fuscirosea TaxID=1291556 RepID=UPI00343C5AEE